ncbi:hypothetical protein U1Q18_038509, partial [Sarracenia purpurea var. burkii]
VKTLQFSTVSQEGGPPVLRARHPPKGLGMTKAIPATIRSEQHKSCRIYSSFDGKIPYYAAQR